MISRGCPPAGARSSCALKFEAMRVSSSWLKQRSESVTYLGFAGVPVNQVHIGRDFGGGYWSYGSKGKSGPHSCRTKVGSWKKVPEKGCSAVSAIDSMNVEYEPGIETLENPGNAIDRRTPVRTRKQYLEYLFNTPRPPCI